ncbi:MAG: LacI family DNA-binding transcriptional regulator [Yersiniaceae bacterium]|uniref:LacI family transcriptional regulator n=1 Tax=Chimaeribacter coloradensis TaxID=2060068 RepID=A0A2N5E9L9_9GAMM|nr:LacI family DNA-binding transcriptional regulator [Chimaeribacter coloradensis]MDU6412472.1 LacI family DNA-binding transcriptional regulator [Yersiniaceae bacterium]PLR38600.1 LacI family transcriptional regulator [Chimaeribacter coloradensis]
MPGKLQMDKISALTGYSVSTVSRVLAGKAYTSERARELILRCARQLGVLDALAGGRLLLGNVAVFAPGRTFNPRGDLFYREVTRGIAEALAAHNVCLSYCGLEEQHADIEAFLDKAGNKQINAVIIIGTDDAAIFRLAAALNKPCVLINTTDRDMALDAISPDHYAIGFNAVRHVFGRGHRRILSLSCLRRNTLYTRLHGIQEAYRHFHVPFDAQQDLIVTEGFSAEEAEQALEAWLASHPVSCWPEVIFPGCMGMASGVLRVLARRRLRVPEDMSLITTDFRWHLENGPGMAVTGIAVPCRELGSEAVHLLQYRLNRPQAPVCHLLLQGRVIEGETVNYATRHAARVALGQ